MPPKRFSGLVSSLGKFLSKSAAERPGQALRQGGRPKSPVQIQIMHARFDKHDTGLHGKIVPAELQGMPLDAREHTPAQRAVMEKMADGVFKNMHALLQAAASSRTAKKTGGNTIVHITSPEFSFYNQTSMYAQDIFRNRILVPLSDAMTQLPPWLTCHLGTMPVQFTDGELNGVEVGDDSFGNCAVYGQCGPNSEGAQYYAKKYHMTPKEVLDAEGSKKYVPGDPYVDSHLKPATIDPFPRVFIVRTESGHECTVLLQICLDHQYRVGHDAFERSPDLPPEGWQDILASSTPVSQDRTMFTLVSHTDPRYDKVGKMGSEEWLLWQRDVLNKVAYQNIPMQQGAFPFSGTRIRVYEPTSPGRLCKHARAAQGDQPIPGSTNLSAKKGDEGDDEHEGGALSK